MLKKLNALLRCNNAVLITSAHNLRYFSGFTGGEGYALITPSSSYLLCDGRYTEQASIEAYGFEVIEYSGGSFYNTLNDLTNSHGVTSIAFEDRFTTQKQYKNIAEKFPAITFVPASDEMENIRAVKEDWEIEKMKQAYAITDAAFNHILKYIAPEISERDIAAELEYFMKKNGADKASFDTIVVSGKRSALPHGLPSDKLLENGDFVTLDFGCIVDGYCSDMTRTVALDKAGSEQKKIYYAVLSAQLAALEYIKAGISCKDADTAARDVIKQAGYGDYFKHSLGHGVGLLIHESPYLSYNSQDILKENMVVTVEPGIYIPDFGGVRIEDMISVTHDGIYNFTQSPKELIEI